MKCPRCQVENPPGTRFCGQCAAPLASVCPSCGASNPHENKFCGQCAAPLDKPGQPRFAAPEFYTPKHLAEKILTSKAALEGERKQVTVLFADLKGSMELLADRDPEEARKLLDPVLELMMEAVHRYEGTVNQVMGDGIMALFGAPLAHEDHAVRACYAALDMHQAVGQHAEELRLREGLDVQIRVGVNSGEVVVRSIGSDLRMDYTAVGQTAHLAARMEQLARPGATLLSRHTLRLAEDFVEVKPLGPVPVKGLPDPVEVYELLRALHVRSRVHAGAGRGLTRFVGRDAELEALHQALEKTRAGHGQVVAVVGEPGVGKSRLFWEFLRSHRTDGWLVLEAGSVSHGRAIPYFPVIDLLRGYFKIQDGDDRRALHEKVTGKLLTLDEALRPTLPALLALLDPRAVDPRWEALDPPHRRERMLEAVKRLLLRESLVQPLCLVVEDLHWIDPESQALLDDLIDGLPTARLLLLLNCRPEYRHAWGAKSHYTQLRIDPLPEESARALVDTLLGADPSLESLKALLIERTEGNPFFLEESVRTLVESRALLGERGAYRTAGATPTIEIPATVRAVLAARIDRLAPEDKRLLQQAAAVGKDVPFPLLRLVAEEPEDALRHRLRTLQAAEFLREARLFPDLGYAFTHALTHEVAYAGLVHDRRKSLHARIANAMDQLYADRVTCYSLDPHERAEALAYHALRGEVWDLAVDALCLAGGAAYARGAVSDTLDRCEQALDILPRLPARPETLRRAVDVRLAFFRPLFAIGQITRLTGLMEEAERLVRELDDQARLATVLSLLAACANFDARYPAASTYGRQVFDIAVATANPTLRLQAATALAMTHRARGEYREAIDQLTPQVNGFDATLARELPSVFGSLYVQACCQLVSCSSFLGRFTDAIRYADLAIAEADAADTPLAQAAAYFYRATPALMRGEFDEALAQLERTHRLCEAKGVFFFLSLSSISMGYALARSGRSEEALAAYDRGMPLQQALGMKSHASFVLDVWGEGLLHVGRLAEARRVADQALELSRTHGEAGYEAVVLVLLGDIAMVQDPPDVGGATGAYAEALTLGSRLGMRPLIAHCYLGLSKLYLLTGKREEAQEHLTMATTMYREMDMRFWLKQAEASWERDSTRMEAPPLP